MDLGKEYLSHSDCLTISESITAKKELETVKNETIRSLRDYRSDLILANDRIRNLENGLEEKDEVLKRVLESLDRIEKQRLAEIKN